MRQDLETDVVRRKAGEIPKTSAEELARLRLLQDGPIDTSDIPERTAQPRFSRDANARQPGRSAPIREADAETSRRRDPRYSESKLDGTVQFLVNDPTRRLGQPALPVGGSHPAMFHLIEFRLDPPTVYWFGAAEVACDIRQVTEEATAAGMPGVPSGCVRNLGEFLMQIRLADGRRGLSHIRCSWGDYGADGSNYRLDFVGVSPLGESRANE